VSVSEPWADRLRACYPDKSVFCITNGFDADDFRPKPESLTSKFTITYTGRLYEGKRDPTPLFEAIQELIRDGVLSREAIQVRFYGAIEPWMPVLVRSFGLEDVVEVAGTVSRDEALLRSENPRSCSCWAGRTLGKPGNTRESCSSTWVRGDPFWRLEAVTGWSQSC
jgi:glycosyltransferase involved in cell wall biosynthesis